MRPSRPQTGTVLRFYYLFASFKYSNLQLTQGRVRARLNRTVSQLFYNLKNLTIWTRIKYLEIIDDYLDFLRDYDIVQLSKLHQLLRSAKLQIRQKLDFNVIKRSAICRDFAHN
ncbi:hypothetical protein BpHYR1_049232 [Brachionus plicatilis]|uniref:Uncharacterized protein n=1 Tax=Brachionus plicatilis TaxID=10195 RepID=A0A3M7RXK1_BRAPC|nr:hypothetical protein BpHYR1_049232 [Brachionus plicatilis]